MRAYKFFLKKVIRQMTKSNLASQTLISKKLSENIRF